MPVTPIGSCREVQEGLTEYLEHALPPARRRGYEEHLSACGACQSLLAELSAAAALLSRLPAVPMPAEMKDALLRALHGRQSA